MSTNPSYHNTLNETVRLFDLEQKAKSQEDRVLEFFDTFRNRSWAPSQIWESVGFKLDNVPITSVRRSISNLVKSGKLIKTAFKQQGIYGRDEYLYLFFNKEVTSERLF